jgi:hypothetical protein
VPPGCRAQVSLIDKLLTAFIQPLQRDDISTPHDLAAPAADPSSDTATSSSSSGGADGASRIYRVHCSLNLNTETGRLSARRPNLQNQPALEKDRYKVRGRARGAHTRLRVHTHAHAWGKEGAPLCASWPNTSPNTQTTTTTTTTHTHT